VLFLGDSHWLAVCHWTNSRGVDCWIPSGLAELGPAKVWCFKELKHDYPTPPNAVEFGNIGLNHMTGAADDFNTGAALRSFWRKPPGG
jgi:hypothetical protein